MYQSGFITEAEPIGDTDKLYDRGVFKRKLVHATMETEVPQYDFCNVETLGQLSTSPKA